MADPIVPDAVLLRAIAPRESGARAKHQALIIDEVGKVLAETLTKYQINTSMRIAHFLAQVIHESDGLVTTEEYASGAAYEGRADLGNTHPGDGRRYKGRGLIQLTGRANYASAGKKLSLDLIDSPDLAATPATSLEIACNYWASRNINVAADQDNIIKATQLVNGGLNGLQSRKDYLAKAKEALAHHQAIRLPPSAHPPLHRGMTGNDVILLQETLRARGSIVAIDGDFGPGTEMAVKRYQTGQGLEADGIVGPATWAALAPAVPAP
jgi:putative chitinase